MTAPTVTVEIAFTSSFSTPEGSRAWTDVTAYVDVDQAAVAIAIGRNDERTLADANSLSLTFDNRDGRFTPEKTTGAYYPNVRIYRPIRITAQYPGGTAQRRVTGYIRSWKPAWRGGSDAMAQVEVMAASRMQRLGLADPLRSIVEEEFLVDGPSAYYTLGDPEGALMASNSAAVTTFGPLVQAGTAGGLRFGDSAGLRTCPLAVASFDGTTFLTHIPVAFYTGSSFYAGCWILSEAIPAASGQFLAFLDTTLGMDTSGHAILGASSVVGPVINNGAWHHVALTWSAATATLYVDGVNIGSAATSGLLRVDSVTVGPDGYAAKMAHVAWDSPAPPAARIGAYYAAGTDGFAGESTSDRADRYLGWRNIPPAEVDVVDTSRAIQHFDPTGTSLLDALRVLESTEAGVLYDAQDGHTRLLGEASRYTATSAFTLSLAEQYVTADFDPDYDDSQVLNDVTVESIDGSTSRAVKASSVDDYGRIADSIKTASTSSAAPADDAAWAITRYSEPSTRLASVTVTVHSITDTVLREAILAASLGTLLTISTLPAQFASSSGQWFVEGYSETFGVGTHYITFNLSPSAAYLSAFVLDSATRGVLNTSTLGH